MVWVLSVSVVSEALSVAMSFVGSVTSLVGTVVVCGVPQESILGPFFCYNIHAYPGA